MNPSLLNDAQRPSYIFLIYSFSQMTVLPLLCPQISYMVFPIPYLLRRDFLHLPTHQYLYPYTLSSLPVTIRKLSMLLPKVNSYIWELPFQPEYHSSDSHLSCAQSTSPFCTGSFPSAQAPALLQNSFPMSASTLFLHSSLSKTPQNSSVLISLQFFSHLLLNPPIRLHPYYSTKIAGQGHQ